MYCVLRLIVYLSFYWIVKCLASTDRGGYDALEKDVPLLIYEV